MALRIRFIATGLLLGLISGCGTREYRWYSEDAMCWHYGDVPPDYPARDECCSKRRWARSELRYHKATGICWQLPACDMCLWPEFEIRENPEPFDFMQDKWSNGSPPDGFCPQHGRKWRLPEYVNMRDCP